MGRQPPQTPRELRREGRPHSPWKYGTGSWAITKGFLWSHVGWLVAQEPIDANRWAPDMLKRPLTARLSGAFGWLALTTFLLPAVLGGLLTWSWQGALTAFFWAGWSESPWSTTSPGVSTRCAHIWGKQPFVSRDESRNVAWLALPSLGESWHNFHHAEPTECPPRRPTHQVDASAAVIRFAEKRGWVHNVKWPKPERIQAKLVQPVTMGGDPRRMTAQQRREQLLSVGKSLFAARGYEAVTMEEIAAAAEVSKPVVYEHFGGKEGLYAVIVDRELQTLLKRITDALTGEHPACCSSRRAWPCSTTSRVTPTDSGCWSETPQSRLAASPVSSSRSPHVEHLLAHQFKTRATTPNSPDVLADAGRDGRSHWTVVARCPQARQGRSSGTPGEPHLQRIQSLGHKPTLDGH